MKNFLKKLLKWPAFPALALLIVFIIINQILSPGYLNKSFISSFLSANVPLIIVSIGVSIVLIGGGIDISMGSLLCLINVVYVTLAGLGYSLLVSVVASLLVGLVGGMINGLCVAIFPRHTAPDYVRDFIRLCRYRALDHAGTDWNDPDRDDQMVFYILGRFRCGRCCSYWSRSCFGF